MKATVYCNGSNITTSVISYDRDQTLCTGIGVLRITVLDTVTLPNLYHEVVLYEDGVKKGSYFVHSIDADRPEQTMTFTCQDASIKLQEYFIAESYLIDYPSDSAYWIKKFLDDATVDYIFDDGDTGSLLSNNTSLGMSSAMDQIQTLLQQNGWYLVFDADNVAHIGKVVVDGNYSEVVNDDIIIEISTVKHDKMFRNRAIVWGSGDPDTQQWAFADIDHTGKNENEYGPTDTRAIVLANSNIREGATAYSMANQLIKEFEKVDFEVTVDLAGPQDINIGDSIFVNSRYLTIGGQVTTIGSSLSSTGQITHIVLNQRCPRLFGYFDYGGYVYVGTQGAGVWRKPLKYDHTWSDFSAGLTDLNIHDLAIDRGVFGCVSLAGHLYTRTIADAAWTRITPYDLTETINGQSYTYPPATGWSPACTIDKTTGQVIGAFNVTDSGLSRSWIYYISSPSVYTVEQFKDIEENVGYHIVDIDNDGTINTVSVVANISGEILLWNNFGENHGRLNNVFKDNTVTLLDNGFDIEKYDGTQADLMPTSRNIVGDGKYIYDVRIVQQWVYIKTWDTTINDAHMDYIEVDYDLLGPIASADNVFAIGNNVVAFLVYTNNGISIYEKDFRKDRERVRDTYLLTGNTGQLLGSLFTVVNGERRWYMLIEDGGVLTLYYYDLDEWNTYYVSSVSLPQTKYQGTYWTSILYKAIRKYNEGIVLVLNAIYEDAYWGDDDKGDPVYVDIDFQYVVYHKFTVPTLHVITSIGDMMGEGAHLGALPSNYVIEYSTLGNTLYVSTYGTYEIDLIGTEESRQEIFKVPLSGAITERILILTGGYGIEDVFIGNDDKLFTILRDDSLYYFYNVERKAITYSMFNPNELVFCPQLDTIDRTFIYWNKGSGDVRREPLGAIDALTSGIVPSGVIPSGVVPSGAVLSGVYDRYILNLFPYELGGYSYNENLTNLNMVFDTVYLNIGSYRFLGGFTEIDKQAIIVPTSGRLFPQTYTRFARNDHLIMQGKQGGLYEEVLDTTSSYKIDVSRPNAPVTAFGGIVYSGIIVSGIQTGYNQGRIYLSPTGVEDTYSTVVLSTLSGYVNDSRFASMITENMSSDYILFPQAGSFLIPESTQSYLYRLDVSSLSSTPTAILADLQPGVEWATFDLAVTHVETTNTQPNPYVFVSLAGVPPTFFQKDAMEYDEVETEFIDRTNNLPNAAILTIRADDQI